jgi:hypothetical protein
MLLKKWLVTPAKAGVQELKSMVSSTSWIPAFAGMTKFDVSVRFQQPVNGEILVGPMSR